MNISYNWLKEYVKFNLSPDELGRVFNSIGLEVESQEETEEIPGGLAGVIVAEVLECVAHPNSDHLHITKVNTGEGEPLQIVCGAPNVAAGQKVMLATLGTKLTIGGEDVKIKKSKIRGVESFGMLCAEDELGVGTDHSGIMVLPADSKVGTPAKEYFHLKSDTTYSVDITPNRIDASSHIGVARDLAAYLKLNNIGGETTFPSVDAFREGDGEGIKVIVKQGDAAPRYSGVTLKNIKVKESPEWLKSKLLSIGLRPINNIVDITNFVMMETGNPMHAFDASKIKGGQIVVDFCKQGTKFTTLDGVERELSDKDLMICNAEEPMCMAGVFGGLDSGVKDETTSIFFESAYFNPTCIRKTSKRHTLKTDASFRYERGCDPAITLYALKRAALLAQELAGGEVVGKVQDVVSKPVEKKIVELNYARMEALIGKKIGADTIKKILEYQEMEFVNSTPEGCTVKVPTYRVDVYRECDVVEDVLRIYGYNNVDLPDHMRCSVNVAPKPDPERIRMIASEYLSANGFMEMMNNSLTKSEYYDSLLTYPRKNCVMIYNPLSSDLNCMRQTLILNGLEVIAYNIHRQQTELKLYEVGNAYFFNPDYVKQEDEKSSLKAYNERPKFAMFITGEGQKGWRNSTVGGDYFSLKGYMELLLKKFGVELKDLDYCGAPADIF
jgi:phenylalanyl-tRNA synthetase beta chain